MNDAILSANRYAGKIVNLAELIRMDQKPFTPAVLNKAQNEYVLIFDAYTEGWTAAVEACASLIERERCRQWSPGECAAQLRDRMKAEKE